MSKMTKRMLFVGVFGLALCSCAPMKFAPAGGFSSSAGVNQATAECRAEFNRDFRNHGGGLSMALDARSAVSECMEGKGYTRADY